MGTFQIFDHNTIPKIANSTVNFFLVIVSSVLLYMCAKHIDFVSNTIFRLFRQCGIFRFSFYYVFESRLLIIPFCIFNLFLWKLSLSKRNLLNTCVYNCTKPKTYTIHTAGNLHNHQVTLRHYHHHSKQQMHRSCGYTEMDLCLWFSLHVHGRLCKLNRHWNNILLEYLHLKHWEKIYLQTWLFGVLTGKWFTPIMLPYFVAMFCDLYVKLSLFLYLYDCWLDYGRV